MRIIIFCDLETEEIWFYTPDVEGEAVFIEPKIVKEKEVADEEDDPVH